MGNVPNLRFPEFSGEWSSQPLTDFMNFKNGLNPDAKRFGRGTKFISVMDILNNQYICYDNIRASVELQDGDIETYGVDYGDILFQRSSETLEDVGRANVYLDSKPAIFGGFVIRGKSKGNYNPLFFRYLLASPTARKRIIVKGAGAQHFNIGQDGLSKVSLDIPRLSEQEKIGKLLQCVDARIATQNKIIEDLKKLKSAITDLLFHSIADAHTIRLGKIAHITNGAGDVQDANTEHQEDWYPFFDRSEELKWFPTYSFDKEAVIYAGEGQSFYPRYYNGKFALHQRCYAITDFASCIIPKYCYHFMNTLNSYFVRNSVGSTVPSLRMDIFQKVEIRLPPIPKQQHICKIIDAFYTKLEVEQRGISILQELKQFLLSQMFI
ncbi:restriction endonuclease subunit S [Bacteroides stercoris]|uniref:restriction endonuclease subunit S n=1 Tax=Bacteroides stercoris TaxID=46506 RepID=UPI00232CFD9B|nr:restriction endonuclease subunit S [Bacteroides stercoris]MDC2283714.1 restriction endonuclease subunit S [Bacteroides stercoris]